MATTEFVSIVTYVPLFPNRLLYRLSIRCGMRAFSFGPQPPRLYRCPHEGRIPNGSRQRMQFAKPSLARKTSPGHSRNSFARYATSIVSLRYQPGELGKWPVLVSEHWLQMAKP